MLGRSRAEESEFDALVRAHWGRAVASARRIVHDEGRAEEFAQEAFTRAFERWDTVAAHPAPDGWVLRVTINLAIDAVRRRTPAVSPPDAVGHEATTVARLVVRQALDSLHGKQREAICLRYLAGLEEAEIASALGCSAGSVKTHLARAMKKLRTQLSSDHLGALTDP